jgi:hypothetical protein
MIGPEMIGNRYPHWSYRESPFPGLSGDERTLDAVIIPL